jgi:hypothetical protein
MRNLPETGLREMCSWERFCAFAREPERRRVGVDARVRVDGVVYEVAPELAGEEVVLWWGLFDQELYVEHGETRSGPYAPSGGPIPLHKYRKPQASKADERAARVEALAVRIGLPRAALAGGELPDPPAALPVAKVTFTDPDPFQTLTFPSPIAAKRAISDELGLALAKLGADDRAFIDALVQETLVKNTVLARIRERFKDRAQGGREC